MPVCEVIKVKIEYIFQIHIFSARIECVFFLKFFSDFSIFPPLSSVIGMSKG